MRRVATASSCSRARLAALAGARQLGASATAPDRRRQGVDDDADDLGRLERPRAERVQEGRRRVRRARTRTSTVKVVGAINDDKIIAALRAGNVARRRQLVHVAERRHLLPVRRLDRPRARTSSATRST